jgi:hypothetical protein
MLDNLKYIPSLGKRASELEGLQASYSTVCVFEQLVPRSAPTLKFRYHVLQTLGPCKLPVGPKSRYTHRRGKKPANSTKTFRALRHTFHTLYDTTVSLLLENGPDRFFHATPCHLIVTGELSGGSFGV